MNTLDHLLTSIVDGKQELTDDLPNFGGSEPTDTSEIWSWDHSRLLIGCCVSELEIVKRSNWEA